MATLDYEPRPALKVRRLGPFAIRDDIAYMLPMGVFLVLTQVGVSWPALYPASYLAKTLAAAALLIWLWPHYTPIRWNRWWLGVFLGVVGIFQWVGMQHGLEHHFAFFRPEPGKAFDPTTYFSAPAWRWGYIVLRIADATLVVPVMEELFWRDFVWRTILAPNNFKLAKVGEWGWAPFLIVPAVFATVHGIWAPTAVVWGLMIGGLLVLTRSLGACILMHAVTNLLLSLYVLRHHEWSLW
jgi:CAAX prenyl protease-like protein